MHCHILPGLDDGARDDEAALDMLRIAERDGILTIVATPHSHHTTVDAICRQLARVKQLARSAGIAVDILPGSEVRIAADLVERYRAGELLTLNGTQYLLLELHLFHDWALEAILSVVERLVDAGLRPLLAHPERYRWVQHDPALVDRLRDAGVTLQVNAPSLFGGHGDAAQAAAQFLIVTHRVGVIASDAHNAGRRSPQLSAAYRRVAQLGGSDYATELEGNVARVIAGDILSRF